MKRMSEFCIAILPGFVLEQLSANKNLLGTPTMSLIEHRLAVLHTLRDITAPGYMDASNELSRTESWVISLWHYGRENRALQAAKKKRSQEIRSTSKYH